MSWWNPTADEAEEQYWYCRNKYSNAFAEKKQWARLEEESRTQLRQTDSQIADCKSQKKSNNKQIEEIKNIIAMLQGKSMFSVNVPEVINTANTSLKNMNEDYQKSIRVSGVAAANLEEAFHVKSVEEDSASAKALELLQREKVALEQLNEQLDSQMTTLNSNMDTLKKQIRQCDAQQSQLQRDMYSYAFDMNHFVKYMYQ